MKLSRLVIAALSVAAATAYADDADLSGQFAHTVAGSQSPAAVAQPFDRSAVNPWSTSYNPLKSFRSQLTRAEVQAEYLRSREAVAAFTGEDSGSAYLAARKPLATGSQFAGQPVNAQ